jgi:ABC-type polysaccharide/polyol phosphate export permease
MGVASHVAGVWQRRALAGAFLSQDLRIKYRRSSLGFLWSLLNPVLMLTVMAVAFSFVFDRGEGKGSFALHLFACLLPWQALAGAVEQGGRSLVRGEGLLLQYPLPKLLLPLRRTLFAFVEYLFATVALALVAGFIGFRPSWALLWLPVGVALLFCFALGLATVTAVTMVYFRDVAHLVSVGMRAWFYLTPILIPYDRIPAEIAQWAQLNPAYHLIKIFDDVINLGVAPDATTLLVATAVALGTLLLGLAVIAAQDRKLVFRL